MQVIHQVSSKHQQDKQPLIAIAASFTVEPVESALSFWIEKLAIPLAIKFAPYNQIFQQLLDPSSPLSTNQQGINIICLRIEDWCRFNQTDGASDSLSTTIKRNAQDLVATLKSAVGHSTTPHILCLCPTSSTIPAGSEQIALFDQTEAWIVDSLSGINGLHLIRFQDVQALYPVREYYDPQRDQLGHIPFTSEFFTALGTALARKIYAIKSSPHKVIVLDCDNTLWKGVVGEDGVLGLDMSSSWKAVQEFMVAQQQTGKLLCLCSKNNEADVMEVFEQRQDMPLKRQHLVSWRINWLPKSENIKSLAAELNLGLDSFIFIDDNPVECAEVSANCPEVLTLQLPIEGDIQRFLDHIWAFDHLQTTQEDTQRTVLYQQNLERQRFQQQALTLGAFLDGLQITIDIAEPTAAQISRVAQLTQRTNQFNFTTIRRTEAEIQQLMKSGIECRAVSVRDRFGDYGLVGVMLFSTTAGALQVDTFLLSCRVLGRGVEHHMIRYLAEYAKDHDVAWIQLNHIPTQKNRPALDFLESIARQQQQPDGTGCCFQLPVDQATTITYTVEVTQSPSLQSASLEAPSVKTSVKSLPTIPQTSKSQLLGQIAAEFYEPKVILAAMQSQRQATHLSDDRLFVIPRTSTENDLSALWTELLGVHPIGLTDNYFELGGTSLQAVELFAQIEKYFGKRLPLTSLLEAPTLEELAKRIDSKEDASKAEQPNCVVSFSNTEGVTPPLFLVHPGGGEVLLYRNLAQRLQPITSVYGVKPYSRRGYPIMHTQIPEMATFYIEQIRAVQPEGPYLLGGFCGGGVIAFEMALQLQQQGFSVPYIVLMNSSDIQESKREKTHQRVSKLKLMLSHVKAKLKILVYKYCVNRVAQPPQFLKGMTVMSVYEVVANDYKPKGQFNGEFLLFKSKNLFSKSKEESSFSPDPLLGWGNRTTVGVKVYESMGDFEGLLQEPYVKEIAERLQISIGSLPGVAPQLTR